MTELSRKPDRSQTRLTRRRIGVLAGTALVAGSVFGARWFNVVASAEGEGLISAPDAYSAAANGSILLIDIRRPDEWARTGIGEGAIPLDMRRADFIDALLAQTGSRRDMPVALICARGVRSRNMTARLVEAGFTRTMDVPEGMLGSGAGPGWLKRGLPLVPWTGQS